MPGTNVNIHYFFLLFLFLMSISQNILIKQMYSGRKKNNLKSFFFFFCFFLQFTNEKCNNGQKTSSNSSTTKFIFSLFSLLPNEIIKFFYSAKKKLNIEHNETRKKKEKNRELQIWFEFTNLGLPLSLHKLTFPPL